MMDLFRKNKELEEIKTVPTNLQEEDYKVLSQVIDIEKYNNLIRNNSLEENEMAEATKAFIKFQNSLRFLLLRQKKTLEYYKRLRG